MFVYVSGRPCLDFAGTLKRRDSDREELLTDPERLSDWAVAAGLLDTPIDVTDNDLAAAIALREAAYRTVISRLDGRDLRPADVALINEWSAQPRLTPRLRRNGSVSREGSASQLLAHLAADLLDLLADAEFENVKRCAHPECTRLYLDSSRAKNRHWCGMSTCGNRAKVRAFRARQRAAHRT
ncbi:hypothetical protein A5791_08345 [Mycobacterium sp. 852002-51163_SCH5372311]|uniref:CGNR zinc finger domain-containing protein n=1 Tax=Mycobacterium sp. 852002-51163_SCH5372311 TaxID=1834097 RepID=UPI000800C3B6|nr:CGNR zinc finger domain-containing protein [Mycobacterium sp. 852002-51163_SCH5372311]OBF80460.1 hypothetical protein A5791_08345 [Mycobacterium sp. 852002-51163_SCH5372311]